MGADLHAVGCPAVLGHRGWQLQLRDLHRRRTQEICANHGARDAVRSAAVAAISGRALGAAVAAAVFATAGGAGASADTRLAVYLVRGGHVAPVRRVVPRT